MYGPIKRVSALGRGLWLGGVWREGGGKRPLPSPEDAVHHFRALEAMARLTS